MCYGLYTIRIIYRVNKLEFSKSVLSSVLLRLIVSYVWLVTTVTRSE